MTRRHADSDDDTYVSVGQPFELLETAEDVRKAKVRKDKEHYVTDSQGRRRFHGAFTGGFSAGYYNTVGSKEGWAPSTFVSSRDSKTSFGGQRPEDFMDDEDFGAHGIAPKLVSAKDKFSQSQEEGTRKRTQPESSVIPGRPPLENLIVPSKSSIGARLLKAMGWKEGEGVGPKVVKYQPQQSTKPIYGCASHGDSELIEGTPSKSAEGFLFAPRDSAPWHFEGKDDVHGLGYRGMEDQGVLRSNKSTRSLYGMSGEAFGTGALEDGEGEEDNVYGVESMTSYDVSLAGEGDLSMERNFGWTGRDNDTWDLSCFTRALKRPSLYKSHPPPVVPKSFVPVHKFKATQGTTSSDTSLKKPLSSTDRSQLLANNKDSVFEFLAPSDRERLKQAAGLTKDTNRPVQTTTHNNREQPVAEPARTAKTTIEWEKEGEKDKLARAAAIFKPLGVTLASRFTRSQENVEAPKSPESDAVQASRANMFGALTRQIQDWYPHRIVCKRFNVPDPYPGQGHVGLAGNKKEKLTDTTRGINFQLTEKMVTSESPEHPSGSPDKEKYNSGPSDNPSTIKETNEEDEPRPPMDLFKTIFADSDSSASSDESDIEPIIKLSEKTQNKSVLPSERKHWQDLSSIEPPRIIKPDDNRTSSYSSRHHSIDTFSRNTNRESHTDERLEPNTDIDFVNHHQSEHKSSNQTSNYGPSLPPDVDVKVVDHHSSLPDSRKSRRYSDDGAGQLKNKKSHKKHRKEDKERRKEHKKRKHKHHSHRKH